VPNRIVRDGYIDSESVCALSDWAHRVYSNLLIKSDDAGRYDGRIEVLKSNLFPLGTTRRADDFRKALGEMAAPRDAEGNPLPPLLILYSHGGKPFVQLTKVQRCSPATVSKFPWSDGTFRITYAKRETRDGAKEFVASSFPDGFNNPSGTHPDPSDPLSRGCTETETETETETTPPNPQGGDVGGGGVEKALRDAGCRSTKAIREILALPGVTADRVRKVAESAKRRARRKTGSDAAAILVTMLKDGELGDATSDKPPNPYGVSTDDLAAAKKVVDSLPVDVRNSLQQAVLDNWGIAPRSTALMIIRMAKRARASPPVSPSGAPPDAADKKLAGSSAGGG
jgi:hypothetical protein